MLTQLAGMFIGKPEEYEKQIRKQTGSQMIHITNGQSDKILSVITAKHIIDNNHRQSLKDNLETFDFRTFADKDFSEHLGKHNRVIIPAEDQGFREFVINEFTKYRDTEGLKAEVYASASYLLLKKSRVIEPQKLSEQTATTVVSHTLNGTEWRPGIIEGKGTRTFNIEKHTNPFAFLKRIATEFKLELHFRVETDGNKVTGRYVDLLVQVGLWRGREVEFGKDLIGIRRTEKTDNVYTALLGLGPKKEDGTRLEVLVEDKEALQRWGRPDPITGKLQHLIETYEPQSSDQDMPLSRLKTLTENELEKRINEVVEYESTIADLENVPGMENKKIRFGDTIKIKDTKFNPSLYLEARVHTQDRSITDKSKKKVELGDYIEYTEEEVKSIWESLQDEIRRKLARMLLITIESTAGDVFKNGTGTTDLTATVFNTGNEIDAAGNFYSYYWTKRDKRGIPVSGYGKTGKTIAVTSAEIDEKATFHAEINDGNGTLAISRYTISNVFDGEKGEQGPNIVDGNTEFQPGYDPSTKETPEGAQDKADTAETNAKTHATNVSEAAYIDAVNDAEAYMDANGIMEGAEYNGVSISNAEGFVTARGDGLVRTVMNSTTGQVFQRRGSVNDLWEDVLYFDTNGNIKYAGELEGASGTFSGDVSGATITGSVLKNTTAQGFDAVVIDEGIDLKDGLPLNAQGRKIDYHLGTRVRSDNLFNEDKSRGLAWYARLTRSVGSITDDLETSYGSGYIEHTTKGTGEIWEEPFQFISDDVRFTGNVQVEGRLINPEAYATTTGAGTNAYIATNGYFARSISGRKYKQDIIPAGVDHTKILDIEPKSWFDKAEVAENGGSNEGLRRYYGAVADEFGEVGLPEYMVLNEDNGEVENFNDRAWTLLIPNINDIKQEMKGLYGKNQELLKRIEKLEAKI